MGVVITDIALAQVVRSIFQSDSVFLGDFECVCERHSE